MRVINLASEQSALHGYEYYKEGSVLSHIQIGDGKYIGKVRDKDGMAYDVSLDVLHTRSTSCNCPFATGRRVVCKHAVALYFAIFPDEATEYKAQLDQEEKECLEWFENRLKLGYFEFKDSPREVANKAIRKK